MFLGTGLNSVIEEEAPRRAVTSNKTHRPRLLEVNEQKKGSTGNFFQGSDGGSPLRTLNTNNSDEGSDSKMKMVDAFLNTSTARP
jgi:hypothetical protein